MAEKAKTIEEVRGLNSMMLFTGLTFLCGGQGVCMIQYNMIYYDIRPYDMIQLLQ